MIYVSQDFPVTSVFFSSIYGEIVFFEYAAELWSNKAQVLVLADNNFLLFTTYI